MRSPSVPPHSGHSPAFNAAVVTLLLAAATGGGYVLDHRVSLTSQAMVYVLAVVIASFLLRWLPSVVCAVGAVIAFNFFFVPPRGTLAVDNHEHLIALLAMLVVALVISHLAAALRSEADMANLHAQRARQLQELASNLAVAGTPGAVLALGQAALDAAFDGPSVVAILDPARGGASPPVLEISVPSNDVDGLQCCMREAAVLGPGTGRWPGLNAWYLPLGGNAEMHGAVCIHNVQASDDDGRAHAQALCVLLAQTLWRLQLSASMLAAQSESQRQQVQSTFLAAVSHDLRTPLASIVGAASSLQTQRDKLSLAEQERLLGSIVDEARHLSTLTENTLQLVQLTNSPQPIQLGWESMEEIVGAVLARVRLHDPARRIQSRVPAGLPLIQANAVLLAQLLGNLLDNALKYSQNTIDLVVSVVANEMHVAVKDRGCAIPVEMHAAIFEPYSRNDQSGQRGAGLGLALCRAIAQAHGGSLVVHRRNGGGNRFTYAMPITPQPSAENVP